MATQASRRRHPILPTKGSSFMVPSVVAAEISASIAFSDFLVFGNGRASECRSGLRSADPPDWQIALIARQIRSSTGLTINPGHTLWGCKQQLDVRRSSKPIVNVMVRNFRTQSLPTNSPNHIIIFPAPPLPRVTVSVVYRAFPLSLQFTVAPRLVWRG